MRYKTGDLFQDIDNLIKGQTVLLIPHVCNNVHKWGAGFVVPLGKRFPESVAAFFQKKDDKLGVVQFVKDENLPIIICNMYAQKGLVEQNLGGGKKSIPLQYLDLQACMFQVKQYAEEIAQNGKSVQIACPKFGSGLAMGDWSIIENMIMRIWNNISVTVYSL